MDRPHYAIAKRTFAALAVLLAVLLFAVTRAPSQEPGATDASKKPNPHWRKDGCASCHTMLDGKPQPIPAATIDKGCLGCHDGERATAEMHPIGHVFDKADYDLPQGWPLVLEGRVGCITCHDVRRACDSAAAEPDSNKAFLRRPKTVAGGDDDWSVTTDFCQGCHRSARSSKFNPHVMLAAGGRDLVEQRCLFCHQHVPDRNAMARTGKADLRSDQVVLCKSCHHTHKEIYKGGHVGVKIPPDVLAYMRGREIVGLLNSPSNDLLNQIKEEKQQPTRMVPAADGTIVCTTCHNPHQQGVFAPESVLANRAMKAIGNRTISPVHNESFCRNCHNL